MWFPLIVLPIIRHVRSMDVLDPRRAGWGARKGGCPLSARPFRTSGMTLHSTSYAKPTTPAEQEHVKYCDSPVLSAYILTISTIFPPSFALPPFPPPPAPSVLRPPPVSGRMVGQYVEYFVQGQTFICPAEYELLKPIGKGAYGVVCSARHIPSGTPVCPFRFLSPSPSATSRPLFWSPHNHEDEPFIEYNQLIVPSGRDVAIKRIGKAFDNVIDAKRTLREVKLLRHFRSFTTHENIIQVRVVAKNT